jgi:hypothetical protein
VRGATKFLAAVAVVGGLAVCTQTASAQPRAAGGFGPSWYHPPHWYPRPFPPLPGPRLDRDYLVYVRQPFGGWTYYGRYETLAQARRVEWQLERFGYRVRVETLVDYGRRW